jgi:hypothetical protein
MRFRATAAIVVLGLASLAATASMARLLLRYRSGDSPVDGAGAARGALEPPVNQAASRRQHGRRHGRHARRPGGTIGR